MRIDIHAAGGGFHEQTRAYAEFRMFSVLARFSGDIERVVVTMTIGPDRERTVECSVVLTFSGRGRLRITAHGEHANEAINRAVERVADLLRANQPMAVQEMV
jgi:ribosome-associated translation inhibitor RaiA